VKFQPAPSGEPVSPIIIIVLFLFCFPSIFKDGGWGETQRRLCFSIFFLFGFVDPREGVGGPISGGFGGGLVNRRR
jgi:hypothetical protein